MIKPAGLSPDVFDGMKQTIILSFDFRSSVLYVSLVAMSISLSRSQRKVNVPMTDSKRSAKDLTEGLKLEA
jgi:hypothetical protein